MMDWDVVYSYTRKQAISEGVLIDVTEQAKETGFKIPVAITSALWDGYIVPKDIPGQSIEGRLHDLLWLLLLRARGNDDNVVFYDVIFQMTEEKQEIVKIKAVIGPGDDPSPVLTIMLSFED